MRMPIVRNSSDSSHPAGIHRGRHGPRDVRRIGGRGTEREAVRRQVLRRRQGEILTCAGTEPRQGYPVQLHQFASRSEARRKRTACRTRKRAAKNRNSRRTSRSCRFPHTQPFPVGELEAKCRAPKGPRAVSPTSPNRAKPKEKGRCRQSALWETASELSFETAKDEARGRSPAVDIEGTTGAE